ncbi:MAG: PAS domain-containing protein, partial [Thermomicrobiales bacterium]|nr:PAS domain-containing protein [Thermomicrobiales bacterium]
MYAHLEASVQASLDAIIATDRTGKVIAWNPAAERLYGRPASQAIGQPLVALISPAAPDAAPHLDRALAGQDVRDEQVLHSVEPGIATQQTLSIFVTRDAQGAVNTLSVVVRAPAGPPTPLFPEQLAPAGATSFRTVVDSLPVAVFLLAPDARQTRLYVSPAVTQITGYTPEEFLKQSWRADWD